MPGEDCWAMGVFSFREVADNQVEVIFSEARLPEALEIRDLWNHEDLGRFDGSFKPVLGPHEGRLFLLKGAV